jgi:hypothetical protein
VLVELAVQLAHLHARKWGFGAFMVLCILETGWRGAQARDGGVELDHEMDVLVVLAKQLARLDLQRRCVGTRTFKLLVWIFS